jgi:hypothetical protein
MQPHVKLASRGRNTLPTYPGSLDYPAMRNSVATIPARVARDPEMTTYSLALLIEMSAAGASEQWVTLPTINYLAKTLHCSRDSVMRSTARLISRGYITILHESHRRRIVKISLPNLMYDMD